MAAVSRTTLVTLAVLAGAVVGLQAWHERAGAPLLPAGAGGNLLYLQSPALARRAALSYDSLLADIYWIRTVQHYGRTKLAAGEAKRYDLLYPLLDLTTSLDPRFDLAYRFGAIFLAEDPPAGAGRPDQAIALLEKGLRAQPGKWQFAQDIGFVHYWWRHDYSGAADWFRRASQMPGGPDWLAGVAAVVFGEGGDRASSRRLWQEILSDRDSQYLRGQAEFRLTQLDAMDQIDTLLRVIAAYRQRSGVPPASWAELIRSGLLRGVPLDPAGRPFAIDAATGGVGLSPESPLNPLPTAERAR